MKTASSYKPSHGFGLLLQGPPKSGKTTTALQFPAPGIVDCDNNLAGPFRWLRHNRSKQFEDIRHDTVNVLPDGEECPSELRWTRMCEIINDILADNTRRTIILDSMSSIAVYLIEHIVANKPSSRDKNMTISDWVPFRNMLAKLVDSLRATRRIVIFTAHEEVNKNDLDGSLLVTVNIPSKLAGNIGGFFSDVWRCESEEVQGEVRFKIRAMPSPMVPSLGNSLGLPKEFYFNGDQLRDIIYRFDSLE